MSGVDALALLTRGAGGVGAQGLDNPGLSAGKGQSFGDLLDAAIQSVDQEQHAAEAGVRGLATAQDLDIHGSMIALEEANIALHAMVSVRDKVVEAYQTLWNMPV